MRGQCSDPGESWTHKRSSECLPDAGWQSCPPLGAQLAAPRSFDIMGCGLRKLENPEECGPGKIYSTLKRSQVETKTDTVYEYLLLDFSLEGRLPLICFSSNRALFNFFANNTNVAQQQLERRWLDLDRRTIWRSALRLIFSHKKKQVPAFQVVRCKPSWKKETIQILFFVITEIILIV